MQGLEALKNCTKYEKARLARTIPVQLPWKFDLPQLETEVIYD